VIQFSARANELRESGFTQQPSTVFDGITDIAAPIVRGDRAAAALAVPFLHPKLATPSLHDVSSMLCAAADEISGTAMVGDDRA